MERTPVDSTNIASVGHEESSGVLEIEFTNGTLYQYFDVPRHVYDELKGAPSPGGYLAANIKGNYRFSRV